MKISRLGEKTDEIIPEVLKAGAEGTHPWKAEVTEGDTGVPESVIADWYKSVYEPAYATSEPDTNEEV